MVAGCPNLVAAKRSGGGFRSKWQKLRRRKYPNHWLLGEGRRRRGARECEIFRVTVRGCTIYEKRMLLPSSGMRRFVCCDDLPTRGSSVVHLTVHSESMTDHRTTRNRATFDAKDRLRNRGYAPCGLLEKPIGLPIPLGALPARHSVHSLRVTS